VIYKCRAFAKNYPLKIAIMVTICNLIKLIGKMLITSFYSQKELISIGFKSLGQNVQISRKASIYNPHVISIGDNVRIDDFCVISGGRGVELGSFIHIGCYSALFGGSKIAVDDFSTLSARVTIYSESDDYKGLSLTHPMIPKDFKPEYTSARVVLRRHVIIGTNSTILPGAILEEGVAVGAHSLVTKDCKAWSIYFGCPAKKHKNRSKTILELEKKFLNQYYSQANQKIGN
jgi:galactoside O-acetyltransferase